MVPLRPRDGLVGARTQFAWGTGPACDGETFPEVYSGLAAMGLTPCRAPQVLRRRVGRHSQPVNPHPMRRREKAPCLSSNRSTMESMIDSGKIHMVDTAVESQPGRATNNTGSRSRPKRALNYPFLAHNEEGSDDEESPWDTLQPRHRLRGSRCWGDLDVCSSPLPRR